MRSASQAADLAASRSLLADLPLLAVAVVWGSSYLAVKQLTDAHTVLPMLVLRFTVVLPVFGVFAWRGLRTLGAAQWRGRRCSG